MIFSVIKTGDRAIMETVRLGRTEMMVSRLGFGGIPIQRVSEDEAIAVVTRCLELGITFIDTANAYTTSEGRIGKAISGRRDEVILATKTLSRSREVVQSHLKFSLERLGVEYLDLYQFHQVGDFESLKAVLSPDGPLGLVEEARKEGLVRHIGISSHQIDVAKEAVKSDRFETVMFPLNFIACEAADKLLPLARDHDVGFIAMKPLAGGRIQNIAVAFKYLLQFPDVVPIPGIEKVHEIEEIVRVLEGQRAITEAELCDMEQLKQELGTRFCRRCDYCQPCSAEIPISMVMNSDNFFMTMPPYRLFSGHIAEMLAKAADCTECGECEERCPYHLPIREMIKEHIDKYQEAKRIYEERLASG